MSGMISNRSRDRRGVEYRYHMRTGPALTPICYSFRARRMALYNRLFRVKEQSSSNVSMPREAVRKLMGNDGISEDRLHLVTGSGKLYKLPNP